MNWFWFAAGYAVGAWLHYNDKRAEDMQRIEDYANRIAVDDMEEDEL